MITLYEFPSCLPNQIPVSLFTTLVRCALTYRQLPFHTDFVRIQHLEALVQRIGVKPTATHPDDSLKYTVPIIADKLNSDDSTPPTVISDLVVILVYLENTYHYSVSNHCPAPLQLTYL
ncbi:hypothetical protein BDV98DRAFT_571482 [Pterulicium gracile]|uniref:Uncharacterized protein n=1 Tax=Pterulicium gracile TaxID=1884261 RepID=A0A5C3QCW0_9AGAR|nr:hypothetical protein BDV98DRAFT_571482 [Pterula gracilis]